MTISEARRGLEIYNPCDCWKNPYFIIENDEVFRSLDCALSEKDYEMLCNRYGINPIYPPFKGQNHKNQ